MQQRNRFAASKCWIRRRSAAACVLAAGTAALPAWRIAAAALPTTRATSQPASRPTSTPSSFTFNFKDAPIDAVIDYLSQHIGFSVMRDGPVDAKVTIVSRTPVTRAQAVVLLDAALRASGFSVLVEGNPADPSLLRIVPRDKAKKAGEVPVYFGDDPDAVPSGDGMITQVIPLQNVTASKLRDDLKPVLSPDTDLAANDGSNSIIVTDSASAVRRLLRIISRLDEHEASTSTLRVVQLKHANAAATAKLIDTLFKPPAAGGPPQQPGMPQQPGQPGAPGAGGADKHSSPVVTAADDRTNTLLVMASPDALKVIDQLIVQLDADTANPAPVAQLRAFPLRFAAADATAKLVNDVFKKPTDENASPYFFFGMSNSNADDKKEVPVHAVADDRTNTLVVTAPAEKMALVATLVQQLDPSPTASTELHVFHLRYASADDAEKVVTDMFQPPDKDSGDNNRTYYFDVPPPEKQPKGVQVKVTSDTRTNTLLVSAPGEMLITIAKVVQELDADPTTEDTMFIYHLRNSQATHLEYTLNVLFGNINSNNSNNQNSSQNGPSIQNNFGQSGQNGIGSSSSLTHSTTGGTNGSNNFNKNRNSNTSSGARSGGNGQIAQADNELTGKVLVVAEPDTNSLLVTTASKYERQVRAIIEDLDHPVAQVEIKVLIAEVTHDNNTDLGVDFSVLNTRANGNGSKGGTTFGAPANGLIANVLEDNVTATLHALATRGKLDVLSRPYILASDNQEANIMVGQIVPFVSESRLDENDNTINTVQYQNIGIILDVTPHINPDGMVILDVAPQISDISASQVSISSGVTSPVFDQRSANSRVGIMDGQTIVIGGLMQDQNTTTIQRVPLLGSIPFLSTLFSRTQVEKTKTELLIFLTPHVAAQPANLLPMSNDEEKGMILTPNAVGPGVFDYHFHGLRRGESSPTTQPTPPTSPVHSIDLGDPLSPR